MKPKPKTTIAAQPLDGPAAVAEVTGAIRVERAPALAPSPKPKRGSR